MKTLKLALGLCAFAAAAQAPAATQIRVNGFSAANGFATGKLSYAPSQFNGSTLNIGQFSLSGTNLTNNTAVTINTFCVDVMTALTVPTTFQIVPLSKLFTGTTATNLSKLITNVVPTNTTQSAALQLAIWDVAFDKGPSYSSTSGSFFTTGGNSDAARTLANTYLGQLSTWSVVQGQTVQLLYNGTSQTQMFATSALSPLSATPEPAEWALLLVGFGAVGAAIRRHRVAAARITFA